MNDRSQPSRKIRRSSLSLARLAVSAAAALIVAPAPPASALTFTLIQNGSGAHLTGYWEQTAMGHWGPVSSNCADFNCCLDLRSADGRIVGNGCGSSAGMGGSLDWSTSSLPGLNYATRVGAVSSQCIYGSAWAELESMTNPPIFRIDPEVSDELPLLFDVRIVPTFCLDAIVEPSTGTAHGAVVARYFVQVNGTTVTADSLVLQLSASSGLSFPGGTGNTVVLPDRRPGDEITIATSLRFEATSTGDGAAQLYTCSAFLPAQITFDVALLNVVTGVEEIARPTKPMLRELFPNPTNLGTRIRYFIPVPGRARLTVHDMGGRLVAGLADRAFTPGERTAFWDGRDRTGFPVPPGVYFVRLAAGSDIQSLKVVITR